MGAVNAGASRTSSSCSPTRACRRSPYKWRGEPLHSDRRSAQRPLHSSGHAGHSLEAGLVAVEAEGLSKRDRALAALDGKSPRELGEIAWRLGAHWHDHTLEEAGNVLDLVRKFFPVDVPSAAFFAERSLANDIERHLISNFGDWTVEYLFEKIGALRARATGSHA